MPANWKVCIDDSCDETRTQYVCAAALMGDRESWNKFNKEWRRELQRSPTLQYFHGKDLPRLTGPFLQFRNKDLYPLPLGMDAAIQKRESLRAVVENSRLIGFGAGVLVADYTRIRNTHPRGEVFMSPDPFEFVLQTLVYQTAKSIAEFRGAVTVRFTCDTSNRAPAYERIYEEWKRWNPNTARSMLDISHEDDSEVYGLQAADMAASSVKMLFGWHFAEAEFPREYPLSSRFWKVANINEAYILEVLDNQSQSRVDEHRRLSPVPTLRDISKFPS